MDTIDLNVIRCCLARVMYDIKMLFDAEGFNAISEWDDWVDMC